MSKHDLVQGYMYMIPLVSNEKVELKSQCCLKNIKIGTSWIRYKNMMKLKWPTFVYHVYIAAILYVCFWTKTVQLRLKSSQTNIVLNQWNENSLDKHSLFTSQWNYVFLHSKPTKLNWTHVDCHTVYTHMLK